MTKKQPKSYTPASSDPAVLFVNVGWADRYDGETTIVGGHEFLDEHGDDCSELALFAAGDDGVYHSGLGRGDLHVTRLDVVFVAKPSPGEAHRVVGVHFDVDASIEAGGGTWMTASTEEVLALLGDQRPQLEWPVGQSMRRWAHRAGGSGREYPDLYRLYRALLEHHGKRPGGFGRRVVDQPLLVPLTVEQGLAGELTPSQRQWVEANAGKAKDRSDEDLGTRWTFAQILALDPNAAEFVGTSGHMGPSLRKVFAHPELVGLSITSFCSQLRFAELSGLLRLIEARKLEQPKLRLMFATPEGCDLDFAYWLHAKMREGKLTAREYPHLGGRRMHVKLLVAEFANGERLAIVGSSNATEAGISSNEELNVAWCPGPGSPDPLARFEERWAKAAKFRPHDFAVETLPERKRRPLFDFQRRAVESIERGLGPLLDQGILKSRTELCGRGGALLVLPTGAGKTLTAMRWIFERVLPKGRRVLWLTHRNELVEQAHDTAMGEAAFVTGKAPSLCLIRAGQRPSLDDLRSSNLIFMSVQQAHSVVKKLGRAKPPEFDLVVIDEAHRASKSRTQYTEVLSKIPHAARLGLTATPYRGQQSDGRNFAEVFQLGAARSSIRASVLASFTVEQIEALPLPGGAKLFASAVPTSVDTKFKTTITATNQVEFQRALCEFDNKRRNKVVVDNWIAHAAGNGPSLIFCVNVAHANELAALINARGHRAHAFHQGEVTAGASQHAPLDGSQMNVDERARILGRFRRGDIEVLCCVQLLTEGFDLPGICAVLLARPTMSTLLLMQMIGRGRRGPAVGGLEVVKLIDFADQLEIHSERDATERFRVARVEDAERAWRDQAQHSEALTVTK